MHYFLRFEQPLWYAWAIPLAIGVFIYKMVFFKQPFYYYSLAWTIAKNGFSFRPPYKRILFLLRTTVFILLIFLLGKPQLVDIRSIIPVQGIDIFIALDISGSMAISDYDKQPRIEAAKKEALDFIQKRTNDAIGLVLFANDALSRVPLTLDKRLLQEIIGTIDIGFLDPNGTMLSAALIAALNRLKNSTAKSKIIILLTDGMPSPHDHDPNVALELAKKLQVKIYTIGIGSNQQNIVYDLWGHPQSTQINEPLLKEIAKQTGGQYFLAENPEDMKNIYNTIDKLEKTKHDNPIYGKYLDIFIPIVWIIIILLILELIVTSTIWFGI